MYAIVFVDDVELCLCHNRVFKCQFPVVLVRLVIVVICKHCFLPRISVFRTLNQHSMTLFAGYKCFSRCVMIPSISMTLFNLVTLTQPINMFITYSFDSNFSHQPIPYKSITNMPQCILLLHITTDKLTVLLK